MGAAQATSRESGLTVKIDPIILGMVRSDVEILLAMVIRDHLGCECVDRRDPEVHADHIAKEVADSLEPPPDPDGSYGEFVRDILDRGAR